jgi:hypothetical protein
MAEDDGTRLYGSPCTEACRTPVRCTTCGLTKAPRGRDLDALIAAAGQEALARAIELLAEDERVMRAVLPGGGR